MRKEVDVSGLLQVLLEYALPSGVSGDLNALSKCQCLAWITVDFAAGVDGAKRVERCRLSLAAMDNFVAIHALTAFKDGANTSKCRFHGVSLVKLAYSMTRI